MRRRGFQLAVALLAVCLLATSAFAQGGGASSTGTIQGKVTDAQGAVLPGVTVTATSPAMLGPQVIGDHRRRATTVSRPCLPAPTP